MPGTGSERLDFVIEQVWGPGIERGDVRAVLPGPVPDGWEVREDYWVVPNLGSAQLLVPRNRRIAARTLSDYAALRGAKTRLVRRLLAAGVTAGFPLSRSSVRIIAPAGAPKTTVPEIGSKIDQPDVVATFGVRTAANAKPTLELRTPAGDAVGFVKLAWNDITRQAIENEAVAMKLMSPEASGAIRAPRVLADGLVGGRQFVMTEPLPRGIRHVPGEYGSLSDPEALGPGTVTDRRAISQIEQVQRVSSRLRTANPFTPATLVERARTLAERVADVDANVPAANFWHGDFVSWNTGRGPDGRLWLFDWETAERDVPAGMDTLHWYTHTRDADNASSIVLRTENAVAYCTRLLRSLGHSETGVSALAAWYAVTLTANEIRLAESLQSWERVKHSPRVLEELLEWGSRHIDRVSTGR